MEGFWQGSIRRMKSLFPEPGWAIEVSSSRSSFFFQAEDGIRDHCVTGVQTCALPIFALVALLIGLVAGLLILVDAVNAIQLSSLGSMLGQLVGVVLGVAILLASLLIYRSKYSSEIGRASCRERV